MVAKSYAPNAALVRYMEDMLRYKKTKNEENVRIEDKALKIDNIKRRKKDRMDIIFESFANIVYFFEFIEKNYEDIGGDFEWDLKDICGYNDLPLKNNVRKALGDPEKENIAEKERHHRRGIVGGPLMRLVRSYLILNYTGKIEGLDFRTVALSDIFISQSIKALLARIVDFDENVLITQDTSRAVIWSRYLAKQVDDVHHSPRRIIE